ncbi:DNA-binding protein [Streptomyces sp. GESEQ-4]|uniref:DNA-binding protein n=1 Tax=Streptomyces sp. GESEQ-4 TaxID=2812655 RepID=UPI001B33FDD0|nr:DNA-binding protein [Streptomyces sp. GESEQ-4]
MGGEANTLLKLLCDRERLTYRKFNERFTATGVELYGRSPNNPTVGEPQFRKWTGGRLVGLPGPETCAILERMFPGYGAERLFKHPSEVIDPQVPAYDPDLEERIAMTASETHEDADATVGMSISDTTIEELHDRVVTLAQKYHRLAPVKAFEEADALRGKVEHQRDRTQVPAQRQALLIINGQVAALLASAAFDLGYLRHARTFARTAALYGETTRFAPLQAFADGTLAYIAYHAGDSTEAVAKADRALSYGGLGDVAQSRLHAIQGRAYAHLGDIASAQRAIRLSEDAGRDRVDELHDSVGGEFGFPAERLAMSNSTTALIIGDSGQAEAAARQALAILGQRSRDAQSAHVQGGAAADLAMARLLANDVDGAAEALVPVWEIPSDQRMTGIVVRTARIHRHLSRPTYHGAQLPGQLRERIEDFTRVSPPYQIGPHVGLLALEA